jgi:acetyltransferase-like isoleucine patch superfamily enzyme
MDRLKKIIKYIVGFFLRFFPPRLAKKISLRFNLLYTIWQSQDFKIFGDRSFIGYPIDIKGGKCIQIGENVSIGKNSIINAWEKYQEDNFTPEITIGNNTSLGEGCHISAIIKVSIGNNVLTGRRISIIDNSHGDSTIEDFTRPPIKRKLVTKGPIIIQDNVWIGDKVTILSGVTIGENSIIGANSVVTKNVPSYSIVGGIPAKIIKTVK